MKDRDDKDMKEVTEGVTSPELLFCDDALVVDYLNALLASEPALNMDFKEIQFVHNPARPGWKSGGMSTDDTGHSIMVETDFLEFQVEELRQENQNLKFKTELATIDAQVLRSENNNLKAEIKDMASLLDEIKSKLNTAQIQNDELKSTVDETLNQLNTLRAQSLMVIPEVTQEVSTIEAEKTSVIIDEPTVLEIDTRETVDFEESEIQESVEFCGAVIESNQPNIPDTALVLQERSTEITTSDPTYNLDRSLLTPAQTEPVAEIQKRQRGPVVFSHSNAIHRIDHHISTPVSKVIKQNQIEAPRDNQQAEQLLKISPIRHELPRADFETMQNLPPVQPLPVEDIENIPDDAALLLQLPLSDSTDDIELDPGQTPKIIIRRNVKNYEDLQKESESANSTEAGHTIVL